MAGSDARQLVWELGKDRVTEDDIVSLAVHNCYVRATVGKERMPAFSMMVRKPDDGDAETAERIRAESGDYVLSAEEIAAQQAEIAKRADEYRNAVKDIREGRSPQRAREGDAPKDLERKNQRSKHFQPPTGKNGNENGKKSKNEEAGE